MEFLKSHQGMLNEEKGTESQSTIKESQQQEQGGRRMTMDDFDPVDVKKNRMTRLKYMMDNVDKFLNMKQRKEPEKDVSKTDVTTEAEQNESFEINSIEEEQEDDEDEDETEQADSEHEEKEDKDPDAELLKMMAFINLLKKKPEKKKDRCPGLAKDRAIAARTARFDLPTGDPIDYQGEAAQISITGDETSEELEKKRKSLIRRQSLANKALLDKRLSHGKRRSINESLPGGEISLDLSSASSLERE